MSAFVVDDEHALAGGHVREGGAHGLRLVRAAVSAALDLGDDHFDGDGVVAAARDDHVGVALGWLDELQMHRLNGREVLVEDFIERPAALRRCRGECGE